jgi:hypothetical protein
MPEQSPSQLIRMTKDALTIRNGLIAHPLLPGGRLCCSNV